MKLGYDLKLGVLIFRNYSSKEKIMKTPHPHQALIVLLAYVAFNLDESDMMTEQDKQDIDKMCLKLNIEPLSTQIFDNDGIPVSFRQYMTSDTYFAEMDKIADEEIDFGGLLERLKKETHSQYHQSSNLN